MALSQTERNRRWQAKNPGYQKRYRAENKETIAVNNRVWTLKTRYGITVEDFDRMLGEQGGRCAVCRSDSPGGRGNFHVDHDHETGKVRGLLCHKCNRALGLLGDSLTVVGSLVTYLNQGEQA